MRASLLVALALVAGCKKAPAPDSGAALAFDPSVATPEEKAGSALFGRYCATCHGQHAEGYVADNAPSLATKTFRETADDAFLTEAIEHGRPGTAMAGYARAVGGPLNPVDVNAIVAFLRHRAPPRVRPAAPMTGDVVNGARVFAQNCVVCHGTPTQRATAVHLANPAFLASADDAFLRYAIEQGRPGTRMLAWAGKLTPGEISDVVAHLRSLAAPVPPPVMPSPNPMPPMPAIPTAPSTEARLPMPDPVINPKGGAPKFTLKENMYVPSADVAKALEKKQRIVIVDARSPSDYLRLHITGAVSVPYYDMADLEKIPNDGTWVIAYCACPHHVSGVVVEELRKRGYKNTAVLDEGVFFWQQQNYPVVAAPGQLPVAAPPPMPLPGALPPREMR